MDDAYRKVGDRFIPESQYQQELAEESAQVQEILAEQSRVIENRNTLDWYVSRNQVNIKRGLTTTLVSYILMREIFWNIYENQMGFWPGMFFPQPNHGDGFTYSFSGLFTFALSILAIWIPARRYPMKTVVVPVAIVSVALGLIARYTYFIWPTRIFGRGEFGNIFSFSGVLLALLVLVFVIARSVRRTEEAFALKADKELSQIFPKLPRRSQPNRQQWFVGYFFDF